MVNNLIGSAIHVFLSAATWVIRILWLASVWYLRVKWDSSKSCVIYANPWNLVDYLWMSQISVQGLWLDSWIKPWAEFLSVLH